MNRGASTSVTVLSSFTSTCSDGPAVSLYGSPTVSPTTAALCASVPLPRVTISPGLSEGTCSIPASIYFLALSPAPPQGGGGGDIERAAVVGPGRPGHDTGVLAELASHLLEDIGGGGAYGADREAGEEEDEHHSQQPADKHVDTGEVAREILPAGEV